MKRTPGSGSESPGWFPLLGVVVQLAALGLVSWAMSTARNRGRELSGGTAAAPMPAPPSAAPPPPFESGQAAWAPGVPPPPTGSVPPPPIP